MNKSDAERISALAEKAGYLKALAMTEADLIIVNMCSVRQTAVDRIYGLKPKFKKIRAKNPRLQTILTGCFLKKDTPKFAEFFNFILKSKNLGSWFKKFSPHKKNLPNYLLRPDNYFKIKPHYANFPLAYLPISTGCNNFCSYCVVPYTRGREIFRPADEIISEVKTLIKKGYQEIWLLGQNVNSYQSKFKGQTIDFPRLLEILSDLPGDFKIYFTSPHPQNFPDKLIDIIARKEKLAKYLHLPVQSGDNEILRRMNRHYTIEDYKNLVKKIKKRIPGVFLSTDIIVGFPGETKKQFEHTAKLIKELGFEKAYVAMYSPRPGTAAAKLKDNVPLKEKKERWLKLNEIIKQNKNKNKKEKTQKLVVILGPTASGKSILAVKLAKKFNGEIISADSRQIYKGMNIGTAKLSQQEMAGIPHYLLDIAEPSKQLSVADYQQLAIEKIKDIQKRGKIPFLVGGSPFYLFSVAEGWSFPKMKADHRLRKQLEKKTTEELLAILKKLDKWRAENIDKKNKRRLIRAIEIAKTLGEVPALKKEALFDCLFLGIALPKEKLRQRISRRVKKMVKSGLAEEAKNLIKKFPSLLLEQTIGYAEWLPYFQGKITQKEAIENIKKHTWQLVKHQMTWFKKKKINWVKNYSQAEKLVRKFLRG